MSNSITAYIDRAKIKATLLFMRASNTPAVLLTGTLRTRIWKKEYVNRPFYKFWINKDGWTRWPRLRSCRVVTTAGVNFLVDDWDNTATDITTFNYHDSGTGIVAEAVGDVGLGTPCGEARDAGTKSQPTANQLRTIATHTYAATFAITEHGIFSATTAGTLWDRSVFTAINVVSGDKIEFTYTLTVNSGG